MANYLNYSPMALSVASMITQYVTGKCIIASINYGVNFYGHRRNRILIDTFYKAGITIIYAGVPLI